MKHGYTFNRVGSNPFLWSFPTFSRGLTVQAAHIWVSTLRLLKLILCLQSSGFSLGPRLVTGFQPVLAPGQLLLDLVHLNADFIFAAVLLLLSCHLKRCKNSTRGSSGFLFLNHAIFSDLLWLCTWTWFLTFFFPLPDVFKTTNLFIERQVDSLQLILELSAQSSCISTDQRLQTNDTKRRRRRLRFMNYMCVCVTLEKKSKYELQTCS